MESENGHGNVMEPEKIGQKSWNFAQNCAKFVSFFLSPLRKQRSRKSALFRLFPQCKSGLRDKLRNDHGMLSSLWEPILACQGPLLPFTLAVALEGREERRGLEWRRWCPTPARGKESGSGKDYGVGGGSGAC